jgi:hypothetical protein
MKSRITVAILVGAFLFAVAAAARAEGRQSGGTEPVSRVFDRPAGVLRASL